VSLGLAWTVVYFYRPRFYQNIVDVI